MARALLYPPRVSTFRRVALLQSHQRLPPVHVYYLNDLVELCGLAAAVQDTVDTVDLPVSPSDREPLATFERYMRRQRPQLVGISCFTCGANSARAYARIAKRYGAFVVAGGFHPSALPDEVLGWQGIDAVVRGEGEEALQALARSGSPEGIAGFSYRSNGQTIHQPVGPVIEDLDALPMPLRHLRPERFGLAGLDYHTDTVYASRGCRGRCRFCANHLVGRTWRPRSNESILAELLTILPPRRGPWKYVKFWDSNFLADPARTEALCLMMLEHGLERHFRFIVETRVEDVIRAAPILKTMRRAGFVRIGCGVESPNRDTHRHLGKGINLDHVGRAAELLDSSEILFTKFLIIGHLHESREDILAYPDYALSHGTRLQKTTVFVMTPYPGTELAEDFAANELVSSSDWDLFTNLGAVIEPNGISSLELQGLHCSVAAGVAVGQRFLEGRSPLQVLEGIFEPLFINISMLRLSDRFSREEVEKAVMTALARIPADRERSVAPHRTSRYFDRLALRFHHPVMASVAIGVTEEHGVERLVVQTGPGHLAHGGRPVREIHLSVPMLVKTIEAINYRRLAHDTATLRLSLRSFRLRWVPSLVAQLGLLAVYLTRILLFQVQGRALARRYRSAAPGR